MQSSTAGAGSGYWSRSLESKKRKIGLRKNFASMLLLASVWKLWQHEDKRRVRGRDVRVADSGGCRC